MGKIVIPAALLRTRPITVTIKKAQKYKNSDILQQKLKEHLKSSKERVEKLN